MHQLGSWLQWYCPGGSLLFIKESRVLCLILQEELCITFLNISRGKLNPRSIICLEEWCRVLLSCCVPCTFSDLLEAATCALVKKKPHEITCERVAAVVKSEVHSLMRGECPPGKDCCMLYFLCPAAYLLVWMTFDSPRSLMRAGYSTPALELGIILLTSPFSL